MSFSPAPDSIPVSSHPIRDLLSVPVLSWALYDFANTIWALNILTLYFPLWVTQDMKAEQWVFSLALSSSMFAVAVTCPMLGAVSDRFGRRIPFLAVLVLVCVVFTGSMDRFGGLTAALVFFAIANFAYQSGNVFYDSLLATVSREDNRGRVSGLGVALGYVGSILGIFMILPIANHWDRGTTFLPTGAIFLLFALPCFLLVKEPASETVWSAKLFREGYAQLFRTLSRARTHANLLRFIAARFLYVDAVNTLLVFMGIYVTEVIGFSNNQVGILLITSSSFAVVGSLFYGRLVDRIGPKRTLTIVLIQWMMVFIAVAATFYAPAFWGIGALAGVCPGRDLDRRPGFSDSAGPAGANGRVFWALPAGGPVRRGHWPYNLGIHDMGILNRWAHRLGRPALPHSRPGPTS